MERMNVELAALEGRKCWGLHRSGDYRVLLTALGLAVSGLHILKTPDFPAYAGMMIKSLGERREGYVKRWGAGVDEILGRLFRDLESLPPRALPMVVAWGTRVTR
jgi:hypothetical protein